MSEKTTYTYFCPYCKIEFTQAVGSYGKGKKKVSSHVVCKQCGYHLPTWSIFLINKLK